MINFKDFNLRPMLCGILFVHQDLFLFGFCRALVDIDHYKFFQCPIHFDELFLLIKQDLNPYHFEP